MAEKGKLSFVLYHDLLEPLKVLSDEERGKLILAVFEYSESGTLPDFEGVLKVTFAFIKAALDRDTAAWEAKREKRRESGSIGGRHRVANQANAAFAEQSQADESTAFAEQSQTEEASTASQSQANQANKANASFAVQETPCQANQAVLVPVNVPVPVNVNVPVKERESTERRAADKPQSAKRFLPPSAETDFGFL